MGIFRLQDAAEYIKTSKASIKFLNILFSIKKVFNFNQERSNRLIRYVQITRAYKANEPINKIAEKYGCDKTTVMRYARMAGLPKRPKHFPKHIKEAVLKDCKKGLPIKVISELHNVSQAYISMLEKENNISRRRKNDNS